MERSCFNSKWGSVKTEIEFCFIAILPSQLKLKCVLKLYNKEIALIKSGLIFSVAYSNAAWLALKQRETKNMEISITGSYIYKKNIIKKYRKTTSSSPSFISLPESVSSASIVLSFILYQVSFT